MQICNKVYFIHILISLNFGPILFDLSDFTGFMIFFSVHNTVRNKSQASTIK